MIEEQFNVKEWMKREGKWLADAIKRMNEDKTPLTVKKPLPNNTRG